MSNTNTSALPVIDGDLTAERIGGRARAIREGLGWSRSDVAARAGVSLAVATAIENGTRLPTISLLYRFAAALEVPPGDLLPGPSSQPRAALHLPLTDDPDSPTAQIVGGGPGNAAQTYLFDFRAGQDDGGFAQHRGDELLVVMEGEVVVSELDRPDETVHAGRSREIDTRVAHGLRAGTTGPARFLVVCTDPCSG